MWIIGVTFCYHSRDVKLCAIAGIYERVQQSRLEATEHAHALFVILRSKCVSLHRFGNTIFDYAVREERKVTRVVTNHRS
jgi:hypothetical protein